MQRQQIRRQLQVLPVGLAGAVQAIANNRVAESCQVPAYLVFAPGLDAYIHERAIATNFQEAKFADRGFAVDGLIDAQRIRMAGEIAPHDCPVALLHFAFAK